MNLDKEKMVSVRATLCLFAAAVIWGVAFVAQKVGADYVGAFTFNGIRFALGGISLLPVIAVFERIPRGSEKRYKNKTTLISGLFSGLILYLAASLQQFGIEITGSAGKSGFITGLYIVIVPILGIFLKRKTTIFTWIGVLFSCAGLFFLSFDGGENFSSLNIGDLTLLFGAFFWAVHILYVDRFSEKINPLRFSLVQFFSCSILSLISAFIFEDVAIMPILGASVPLLYSGILSVGLAYTLQVVGQRHVQPARAAVIFSMESLFSALGSAVIIGEFLLGTGYVGCAFIFAGIIISQLNFKKTK